MFHQTNQSLHCIVLTGQNQGGRTLFLQTDDLIGGDGLLRVGGTEDLQPRDAAQHRDLFDGLVGRSILPHRDRIVAEEEEDAQMLKSGEP